MRGIGLLIVAVACAARTSIPDPPPATVRCYAGTLEDAHFQKQRVKLRWRVDPRANQIVEDWTDSRTVTTVYRVETRGDAYHVAARNVEGALFGQPWTWSELSTTHHVGEGTVERRLEFRGDVVTGGGSFTHFELHAIPCATDGPSAHQ
jgi:phytoene dehydrogenase-like protein